MKTLRKLMIAMCLLFGIQGAAQAEDMWGCEVLLCLSNPAGPTAVSECKPPITKLWRHLAKGGSFPTCGLAEGNDPSQNWAQQVVNPFDPCNLQGLNEAPLGWIAEGKKRTDIQPSPFNGARAYKLSKSPMLSAGYTNSGFGRNRDTTTPSYKVCVNNYEGSYSVRESKDSSYTVNVFDKVEVQKAQSPRAIDVYIDKKLFTRVHW